MPIHAWEGHLPQIDPTAFVHPNAVVIGRVVIGPNSSVWPGVVIRGDVNAITIGAQTNIQDHAVLHVGRPTDEHPSGAPLVIGDGVTVGHRAVLHGCRLESFCLIGIGAIVLDHAVVGQEAVIGAGSLLPPGKKVEACTLWLGSPARFHRPVTPEERLHHRLAADHYLLLAAQHRRSLPPESPTPPPRNTRGIEDRGSS